MEAERVARFNWLRLAYLLCIPAGIVVPVFYDIAAPVFDAVSIHSKVMRGEVAAPVWRSFVVFVLLFMVQGWSVAFVLTYSGVARSFWKRIPMAAVMLFAYFHDFDRDVNGSLNRYGSLNTTFFAYVERLEQCRELDGLVRWADSFEKRNSSAETVDSLRHDGDEIPKAMASAFLNPHPLIVSPKESQSVLVFDFKVAWEATIYLIVLREPVKSRFLFTDSRMEYLVHPRVLVRLVTSPRR